MLILNKLLTLFVRKNVKRCELSKIANPRKVKNGHR